MQNKQINDILEKYRDGLASENELNRLHDWYRATAYTDAEYPDEPESVKNRIFLRIHQSINPKTEGRFLFWRWGAVAAIVLLVSTALLFFKSILRQNSEYKNILNAKNISSGKNSAVLTLASGKVITLSAEKKGILSTASNLTYTDGTAIDPGLHSSEAAPLTIATPRGGQYQAVLPDGTRVWLNAASSLKFPSRFSGTERLVELNGEAYFEVTKLSLASASGGVKHKMPFIVVSRGQKVEVLGTHFNVNSYSDEDKVKTTLLEGTVRVSRYPEAENIKSSEVVLSPGQQSLQNEVEFVVQEVDATYAVDWKNGKFSFKNEPLQSIMRKVARWYNVKVTYQNEQLMTRKFSGKVSRYDDVYEVLRILEMTGGAKFKVEGTKITIL
jgi:transmembrane sensor